MNMRTIDSRLEIKNLTSAGVFSGYGSVFDVADLGDDIVATGAFSDSLSEWNAKGTLPALLWQHKASEPIGAYTRMSEDTKGLFVEGQLALKTQRGAEAYDLLKMKAISGLSIGFMTRDDSYDQKTGVRTVKKADLWEVSLVTFPMQDRARIDSVKSIPDFQSISEFEKWLRDTSTLSRTDAAAVVSKAKILFQRDSDDTKSSRAVLDALERRRSVFQPAT